MKLVDKIIADIPLCEIEKEESEYHIEYKYYVDTKILLDNLRQYEVDIPKEQYRENEHLFDNGVLQYMAILTDTEIKDFKGGNTYNYNGRIIHDLDYRYVETKDKGFYIAIRVHRLGDIRANYTEYALFKFDSFEDFFETIDEICIENFSSCFKYNGKHYYYDIFIFDESLRVWCEETQKSYDMFISNDNEFKERIDYEES